MENTKKKILKKMTAEGWEEREALATPAQRDKEKKAPTKAERLEIERFKKQMKDKE